MPDSKGLLSPDYKAAESAALELLNRAGVYHPPVNPIEIAQLVGLDVRFVQFSGVSEGVSGLFNFRENAIYVNNNDAGKRQTFTIAHELGHAILHKDWAETDEYKVLWRDLRRQSNDRRETEANTFAANLLMPRAMVKPYAMLNVSQLSRLFAVSEAVVKIRLQNLSNVL